MANKAVKQGQKTVGSAPSSLILTNYSFCILFVRGSDI